MASPTPAPRGPSPVYQAVRPLPRGGPRAQQRRQDGGVAAGLPGDGQRPLAEVRAVRVRGGLVVEGAQPVHPHAQQRRQRCREAGFADARYMWWSTSSTVRAGGSPLTRLVSRPAGSPPRVILRTWRG